MDFSNIPQDVQDRLDELQFNCECVDNIRVADASNADEVAVYDSLASIGCCGRVDEEFTSSNGHTYLIGFNHGH